MTRGEQFRLLRKGLGFTQKRLSERTGVTVCTIRWFETGRSTPSLDTYELLLKGLGCQVKIERIKEERKK